MYNVNRKDYNNCCKVSVGSVTLYVLMGTNFLKT